MGRHANALRSGWIFDPESVRATRRNREALRLLRSAGIDSEWACSEHEPGVHTDGCRLQFDEWVSDAILEAAYRLADEVITERGLFNRRAMERRDWM